MQVILGAGGAIANALQKELEVTNEKIRLVSRKTIQASGNTSWQKADLTNYQETLSAVNNADVVYLCAGLVYDSLIWQQQWPVIMQNVINAAKANNARLIFFDNVYMYGLVKGIMTEDTPYNPCSKKGEVRAKIAENLMGEVKAGNIKACIARAPDFYGAGTMNSYFDMMVLSKFAKKQSAQWMGNPSALHSFILVSDAAKAVATLGKNPQSDQQIWHLPTAKPLSGLSFINLAAKAFDTKPKFMRVNKLMLKALGLFNPLIKNTVEMYYQNEFDYQFNSDKFESTFSMNPTAYQISFQNLAAASSRN